MAESSTFSCPSDCVSVMSLDANPSETTLGGSPFAHQPAVFISTAAGELTLQTTLVTAQLVPEQELEPPETLSSAYLTSSALTGQFILATDCGKAVFTDLAVRRKGNYTMQFSALIGGILLEAESARFTITRGYVHHIGMSVNPAGFRPAQPFRVQPVVTVEDVSGNLIDSGPQASRAITASLNHGQRTVALGPSNNLQRNALEGIVKFVDLELPSDALNQTFWIIFSSGEHLLPAHSQVFVVAEEAAVVVIMQHTAGGVAIQPFPVQPSVVILDKYGNLCTWYEGEGVVVVADLDSPTPQASMLGDKSQRATGGRAAFTDLNIDKAGLGFRMLFRVSSGVADPAGVTTAISLPFNVTFGAAYQLALHPDFVPAAASPGDPLGVQPRVYVQDVVGNTVADAEISITASLLQHGMPVAPGVLKGSVVRPSCPQPTPGVCDCSVNLGCGVATWPPTADGLRLDTVGDNYTIRFASPGLLPVDSFPGLEVRFGVVNAIEISRQPWGLRMGENIRGPGAVRVLDKAGNFIPSDSTPVKVEMSVGGVCCYPPSVEVISSDGIAVFDQLVVTSVPTSVTGMGGIVVPLGSEIRLRFSSIEAPEYVESDVLLIAGAPVALNVTQQPGDAMPGIGLGLPPIVQMQDAAHIRAGWYRDQPATITATLCFNVPCVFGTYLDGVGSGQPCFRCSTDIDDTCSLHPETPPLLRPPQIPNVSHVLSGAMTQAVHDGEGAFSDLVFNPVGTYRFKFSAVGFDSIFSDPFTVFDGPIHHFAVLTQPDTSLPLSAFDAQPLIELQDAGNNRATSEFTAVVTASLRQLGGVYAGKLLPENPTTMDTHVRVQAGLAWFQGLRISTAGTFRVVFESTQLSTVPEIESDIVDIPIGPAAKVIVTTLPSACVVGGNCAVVPQLEVQDEFGHLVTTWSGLVSVDVLSAGCDFGAGNGWGSEVLPVVNGSAVATQFGVQAPPEPSNWTDSCNGQFHLNASGPDLRWTLSSTFLATLPAYQLSVVANPLPSLPGGSLRMQPQLEVRDEDGRCVRGTSPEVSVDLLKCDPSSQDVQACQPVTEYPLIGTRRVRAVDGVVSFTDLRVDKADFCYRLAFSSVGLVGTQSSPLDVTVGAFVFFFDVVVEPSAVVAGRSFGIQPQVAAMDAGKNRITELTVQIAATLQLNGERTTLLLGARSQVGNDGTVTFTDLRIDRAGDCNRLVFEGRGKRAFSLSFTVWPAAPTNLTLARAPASPDPGWPFQLQPVVSVTDAVGNVVSGSTCVEYCHLLSASVFVTLVPRANSDVWAQQAVLQGRQTVFLDSNAIATFTDLRVDEAGTYDLNFTSSTALHLVSSELVVEAAADRASRLKVLVEPFGVRSFSPFKIQPAVAVVDMSGNLIRSANTTITVTLLGGDVPGLVFYGQKAQPTVDGIATFDGLQIGDEPAFAVFLHFAGDGQCSSSGGECKTTTTRDFDVAGAMAQIEFITPPPDVAIAGAAFDMQPSMRLLDASGRLYTWWDTNRDTIFVTSLPNSTLSCNSSEPNVTNCVNDTLVDPSAAGSLRGANVSLYSSGIATFTDLRLDRIPSDEFGGPTRRLRFSVAAPSLEVFTLDHCCVTIIHAEPSVLLLLTEPREARPGLSFVVSPALMAYDAFGNFADSGPALTVTATLLKDGVEASEEDYPSVGAAVNDTIAGAVTLSTLGYNREGAGFSIQFSSPGLTGLQSQRFSLATSATPFMLVIIVEPQGFHSNDEFRIQPVVEARDRGSNVVTSAGSVRASLLGGVAVGASLEPTPNTLVSLVDGVGTFSALRVSRSGRGMQLEFALVNSTIVARSSPFEVGRNVSQLNITTQPATHPTFAAQAFEPQPSIELLDSDGFRASNHTALSVTASLIQSAGPSPCPSASPLRCVIGGACAPSFDQCPVLQGQLSAEAAFGVVLFTDLRIAGCNSRDEAACFHVDYQLSFTINPSISSVLSDTFVVNRGPAAVLHLARSHISTFPGYVFPTQPEVWVLDLGGNVVEAFQDVVSVHLEPAQNCLLCTSCPCSQSLQWFGQRGIQPVLGRAVFQGLGIDTAGGAYRFTFSAPGVASASSDLFDLAVGPGVALRLVAHDSLTTGGVAFVATVEAIDLGGNRVQSLFGAAVSATLARGGEGTGRLLGTTSVSFVFGLADFFALEIDKEGSCYVLSFASDGLTGCESEPITVNVGPAEAIVMLTQPAGFVAGKTFEVAPEVAVVDGGGNIVETATDVLEVWLLDGGGQRSPLCSWALLGAPACVFAVKAVRGRAIFHGLHVDTAGTGFALRFGKNRGGFQEATSDAFDVSVGPAVILELARLPQVTTDPRGQPGYVLAVQPWVAVRDAGGNLVPGGGEMVNAELWLEGKEADTLEVALWEQPFRLYNPLLPTQGAVDRSLNREALFGLATFTNLQVDRVKQGFSIRFTSPGLAWVETAPFDIVLGAAYTVGVQRLPLGARSGQPFIFQPVVHLQDRGRNRILASPEFLMIAALQDGSGNLYPDIAQLAPIVGGVAVFSGLAIRGQGVHTVKFSASALETDDTPPFNVSGDAHAIDMTVQPGALTAAAVLPTQPHVRITDDISVTVEADFATEVTANITTASNTRSAVLLGSTTVRCCWGQCHFTDLAVSKAGEAYVLSFFAPGLVPTLSQPLAVLGPSRLNVTVQPQGGPTQQTLPVQPVVRVTDERHTLMVDCELTSCHMDSAAVVTATIKERTGGLPLASLQGNRTAIVVAGVANFTDLAITGAGRGYVEFGYVLVFSHVELYIVEGVPFALQYPPGPQVPIVYAKVRLFGINRAAFGIPQQQAFRRAIADRTSTEEGDVIVLSTADSGSAAPRRRSLLSALQARRLLQDRPGLEVAFHVECETEEQALAIQTELEVMLLLDGELTRALETHGLFIEGSILLEGPTARAADGSELSAEVETDNTAGIIGAAVGCVLALCCGVACYIGYWRARKRALIRSEDEDDLMWAIGVEYPKDDVDAALPWMAEKMLDKEKTVEKELSLRSVSAKT